MTAADLGGTLGYLKPTGTHNIPCSRTPAGGGHRQEWKTDASSCAQRSHPGKRHKVIRRGDYLQVCASPGMALSLVTRVTHSGFASEGGTLAGGVHVGKDDPDSNNRTRVKIASILARINKPDACDHRCDMGP